MRDKFVLTRGKLILIILIILIIIGVVFGINIAKNNNTEKYVEFEEQLQEQAENYYDIYMVDEDDLEEGEKQKITLKKLIEVNLISEDEELAQKCNGYVIISNDETELEDVYEINYQPYIKCGKRYISTNYEYAKYKENW